MWYHKHYTVKYTKVFETGLLKGLSVECLITHADLDHATRFVGALGCSSKLHEELFTKDKYHAVCARIYAPGELTSKGEVI